MPYQSQPSPWSFTREPEQANDPVQPPHYDFPGVQVISLTEHLNFCRGNVVKYVARAGRKSPSSELEDLRKAAWYLQREIARLESERSSRVGH
jgi:hypothetical protein